MKNNIRRPYLMAVVLGTALAAGSAQASGGEAISAADINNVSRYCVACWRNAHLPEDQWNDCTQEVLCRLLRNVPAGSWTRLLAEETEERREFVRAIDAVKKRCQRSRRANASMPELIGDRRLEESRSRNEEREAVAYAAQRVLSARQQRILNLIGEGHNVADIASELALTPERVSDEKYKAIQKLRTFFAGSR